MATNRTDGALDFDIGMNCFEWPAPAPKAHDPGLSPCAPKVLLTLPQGQRVLRDLPDEVAPQTGR